MAAFGRTPDFPHATPVGPLSAQLRRPRPRSATGALRRQQPSAMRPRDYQVAGGIGFDPDASIEILRIANAIGNAAAQSSAMTQNARGPSAP